mmetsp:Transcript_976/g.2592  ORF Transcript_976/g.2592 Transcript_976/m.2592 type:complete len:200 (+) Transcript_976:1802-2401(+)
MCWWGVCAPQMPGGLWCRLEARAGTGCMQRGILRMPRTTTTPGVGVGVEGDIAHLDADPLPPGVAAARAVVVITKTTTAPAPLTGVRGEDEVLDADALPQGVGAARLERPRRAVARQGPIAACRRHDAVGRPRRRWQLERLGAAVQQQRRRRRDVARRRGRPLRRRRRRELRRLGLRLDGERGRGRCLGSGRVPDRIMT